MYNLNLQPMKKPLLLGLSVMLGIATLSAQGKFRKLPSKASAQKGINLRKNSEIDASVQFPQKKSTLLQSNAKAAAAPPYKKMSSSYNLLTLLVSQSNCLSYNKELGAVAFTHRQSPNFGNTGANSGNTQITYTSDWGNNWDSLVYGYSQGSSAYRYPSGAIYNPTGNTTIANAYAVGSGPITTGSGWVGNYYVSGQLNGNNLNSIEHMAGGGAWPTHYFARIDFDMVNGNAKVASMLTDDENYTNFRGTIISTGTFNTGTNTFDWTFDSIKPNAQADGLGDLMIGLGYQAWSENGQIGYVVTYGVDAAATTPETRTYQPMVYKTTDGGANWAQYMPAFDWLTTMINSGYGQMLYSYDGINAKPFFTTANGSDVTVDKNGELHMAIQVTSGYSDDQDSLGYVFSNIGNYIYDAYTDPIDGYKIELIDSIQANASNGEASLVWFDSQSSTFYDNDARLQISKNEDGSKLFFVWADSDISQLSDPINALPYLCFKGVTVDGRCWTSKDSLFASGDAAWYHYVSPVTKGVSGTYNIPVSYAASADGSYSVLTQVDHYFMDDVMFTDSDFDPLCANSANQSASSINVSVFPNPSNGVATLSVKMNAANEVKVVVYNSLGQVVFTNKVAGVAGVNNINLATENLSAGVYFYEVKAGDYSVTDKMMIQK
jgi:hypothetical protein